MGEAIRLFPNFNTTIITDVNLAKLFVNTTACVLARTRCAAINPITGAYLTDQDLITKIYPPINALFVNSDYDLYIVQLPFGQGSFEECAKYRNVKQALWPGVQC